MTNYLRPDEAVALSEIERARSRDRNLSKGLKTLGVLGGAAIGTGLSDKILPFLNEFIPQDLAMKGISKIAPKVGEFLKKGQSMGLDLKEGFDFVKNNLFKKETSQPNKEPKNIIEKYSPDLHQFIDEMIRQGRKPLIAASIAEKDKRFTDIIKKIKKDYKLPWFWIINSIYGSGEEALPEVQNAISEREQTQQPQNQQQQGPGQAALMNILQKIMQIRGGDPSGPA